MSCASFAPPEKRLRSRTPKEASRKKRHSRIGCAFGCEALTVNLTRSYGICTGMIALPIGMLAPGIAMVFSKVPVG